ncbi:MAG: peptidylprolyl isomerase [Candidatus Magasanikbacteria bacterium]|nr:peptidylprolyl isomerase [Candidatus Magasanikbacteria bacterium]
MSEINAAGEKNTNSVKMASPKLFIVLGAAALLLVGTVGFGVYRVYAKAASDKFTLAVAKTLRLPAVKVGDDTISYVRYSEDLKAIRAMRDYDVTQRANGVPLERSPGADLTEDQMSDQVLWRLINNLLVEEAAKQYEVSVEEQDVNNLKDQMRAQFKDEAALEEELMKRYGWSFADYEQKVIRPFILQSKLAKKMQEDPSVKESLKAKAQEVLEEVKKGADFAALAKQYNGDSTKGTGGDLGWFGKGRMVPEFETAVFSLKKGEVYPTVVESIYGFHIIKLDDRKTESVKDENGKTQNEEQLRASHIFFKLPDLISYLDETIKNNKPKLYIKVHDPFAEQDAQAE